jgi:deoxyribonuclease-4
MSIAGGLVHAVEKAEQAGATALQIFTRNQVRWESPPLQAAEACAFRQAVANSPIRYLCAHASYLINLASTNAVTRQRSLAALTAEMRRADALGCHCLIMHPGAPKEDGAAVGIRRVVDGVRKVLEQTTDLQVRLALENTAGQGSVLGAYGKELAEMVRQIAHPDRVGVCLDSCHAFTAGIDLRAPAAVSALARELDERLGLERVYVLHLNDSKTDCGSRIDRHQHIGKGLIGDAGFRNLLLEPAFAGIPGILETPKSDDHSLTADIENLQRLRELAGD